MSAGKNILNDLNFWDSYVKNIDYGDIDEDEEPSLFYINADGQIDQYYAENLFDIFKNSHVNASFISEYSLGKQSKVYIVERTYEEPLDPEGARNELLTKKSFKEMRFFDVSFIHDAIDQKFVTLSIKDEELDLILVGLYNILIKRDLPLSCPHDYIFMQVDIEKTTTTHKIPLKLSIMAKGEDNIVCKWAVQKEPLDVLLCVHHENGKIVWGSYLTKNDIEEILDTMRIFNTSRDTVLF